MSLFGVFQDFHWHSFCSLEGLRTLTPEGMEPPGGAIREVRKPGLRMESQVWLWVVPCLIPLGKPLVMFFKLRGPGGYCGIRSTDGSTCQPLKIKREEITHLCSPSHPQSPVFPGFGMSSYEAKLHVTCESWFTLTFIPFLCFTIVISHTHYFLRCNNL